MSQGRPNFAGGGRSGKCGMGNSGDKKFLSQLEKLATDSDEAVSESAAWAIRKRSDPE